VRHGFLMSRQTRAILNDNRRLAPVKMVPAHFRAQLRFVADILQENGPFSGARAPESVR